MSFALSEENKRIDGKAVAALVRQEVAAEVAQRTTKGQVIPGLAVVLVGEDPASAVYVRNKIKACEEVGFVSRHYTFGTDLTQQALLELIDELNADAEIHGILVQLPLPKHIDVSTVIERISPAKDVDGFHPYNLGRLAAGSPTLRPCTPYGCMRLLDTYGIDVKGKKACVVGVSNIVGRPAALELLMRGATVTICHIETQDLPAELKQADIVLVAIGVPRFIQADWLKPGAVVIDVGINRLEDGSLCGDVDFDAAKDKLKGITPVPGGVGPMTIASLLRNTLEACQAIED